MSAIRPDVYDSIFILEDLPPSGSVVKPLLEKRLGLECHSFEDPVNLINGVCKDKPVVFIIDFSSNMRGDIIIKKVREKNKHSLIIMLSNDDNKENLIKALQAGANNVFLRNYVMNLPSLISNHLAVRNSKEYRQLRYKYKEVNVKQA